MMEDFQTILVTGGAGFIGSNFINLHVKNHPKIKFINVDKLTYASNLKNIQVGDAENYSFYKADIANKKALEPIFASEKIDGVINFAAETHVDNSINNSDVFIRSNIIGVKNLLDLALKYKIKRFLQVSTDEVYGEIEVGQFKEDSPISPNNPYSASKASADLFVHVYHRTYGLNTVITRSSNNFGPNQHDEKLIPTVIRCIVQNKKIPVYGTGKNVRDWIFVEDNCRAIWTVFLRGKTDNIYNIGAENEKENLELIRLILRYMNKGEELIEYVKDRPGHDKRYAMDVSKIKQELSWHPEVDFESALKKTINFYINKYGGKK